MKTKIKEVIIGRVFNLYFMRGWARMGFFVNWLITMFTWIGMISLVLNYHPRSMLGWIWVGFVTVVVSFIIFLIVTYYGYWDLGKGGTRIPEMLRDFERSAPALIMWDTMFDAFKNIPGFKPSDDFLKTAEWVKKSRKELGV